MSSGEPSKDATSLPAVAQPDAAHSAILLADALADQGRIEESIVHYQRAIAARPNFAPARQNLAASWLQLGNYEQAIAESRATLALQPEQPLALNILGIALDHCGRMEEAIKALTAALRINPGYAKAAHNLGNALARCGRNEEAIAAYRRALEIDPSLSHAAFNLAALGAVAPPPQMPRSYLTAFFNGYAPRFERHMQELRYVAPRLLADAVLAAENREFDEAVDLGCGTGLVGALFRSRVRHFIGVDLADAMIAIARERGIYDELANDELVDYLRRRTAAIDLLLAADVLIYFGELEELFAAAAARLRSGGMFAFSIEATSDCDCRLQPSQRYAHSADYIRRLAALHRWTEMAAIDCKLRDEPGAGANGIVFVYRA